MQGFNKITSFIFIFLFVATGLRSQNASFESIGNYKRYKPYDDGVLITAQNALLRLYFYQPGIVRIRAIKGENLPPEKHSYSVIQSPDPKGARYFIAKNNSTEMVVVTSDLQIVIQKQPLRITFLNKEGIMLNQDEPGFGMGWQGNKVSCYKSYLAGEHFIGLGEKTGSLDKKGHSFVNWNSSPMGYSLDQDPLYASIPFFIGIHSGSAYGIYFDNTFKSTFNFGANNDRFSSFGAEGGELDYYFFGGGNVKKIISDYTWLTGRMPMPPKWSLGYHQSRWSYYPNSEVLRIAKTFREKQIPADAIHLDIHYMDNFKVFTWSNQDFPQPNETVDQLERLGFKTVAIIHPGIKAEKGYRLYDEGISNGYFVKYPDQTNYIGQVWPGWSLFPDFTNASVRGWWGKQFQDMVELGVDGFWNDMNEPSVWGGTFPDLVEFDLNGQKGTHLQAHNIYGLQMARSTYEGSKSLMKGNRPFNLSRSGFAGIQRYAALWTGDNIASDEHMLAGIRMVSSLGLSGVAFSGYDVGGFRDTPGKELMARWLSVGAFSPFFRNHTEINTASQEPWAFGESVEAHARNMIGFRYQLLPYLYSIFFEAHSQGIPVQRSLALEYPQVEKVFDPEYENQYFFGPSFLVAPLKSTEQAKGVFLPEGNWYHWKTDHLYEGNRVEYVKAGEFELPVFIKEGSIVPMQAKVQSTAETPGEILYLHVYKGERNHTFWYYEDDGISYGYEKDSFYKREMVFDPFKKQLVLKKKEGSYTTSFRRVRFLLHGFTSESAVEVNGKNLQRNNNLWVAEIPFSDTEIVLQW